VAGPTNVEIIKATSEGLRGTIGSELGSPAPKFRDDDLQLLKFHGVYQQEDRDARLSLTRDERLEIPADARPPKSYSYMVRTKNPGGYVPASFFLAFADLCDSHGNGTLRITTRQGFQIHGVDKTELKDVVAAINENFGSTLGACGDINRNVMAPAAPFLSKEYVVARETAHAIAELLTPRTGAYYEIWLDGEMAHTSHEPDPLYGETYLPRKFKIAVGVAGDNSVDVLTNDLGIVPIFSDVDVLVGFDLYVGGGLGMTHRKPATFPRLAEPLGFVEPADLTRVVYAIVEVQRDYGDRTNRKHARLKYTIEDRGIAWFRGEVERYAKLTLGAFRPLPPWKHRDYLGWHEQGDGRLFLGVSIRSGRIKDDGSFELKSALREIVARFGLDVVLTPQQNLLVVDVLRTARDEIDAILERRGVRRVEEISLLERHALACPALPTCGLALAESERALPALVHDLERRLVAHGLGDEPISIRMTGCPNGCARPYTAEIGIVGVSGDRYNLSLGGSTDSTRLNRVFRELLPLAEIAPVLDGIFADFARERMTGEPFGEWCARTLLAEREAALV